MKNIRFNSNNVSHAPYRFWQVAMTDHSTPEYRPVLSLEIGLANP